VAYPPSIFSDPFDRSDEEKQIGRPGELGQPVAPPVPKPSIFSDPDDHAGLERAITTGQQTGPDEAARVLKLRLKTGLPADVIKRNVDTIERETQRKDFDAETFRRESPYLATWLTSDAYHAALTKDDLPALSAMEKALRMGRTIGRVGVGGAIGVLRGTAGTVQAGAELADILSTGAANLGRALPLPVEDSALTRFAKESTEGGRQLGERFAPPADAGFLASAAYGGVESAGQMLPSILIGLISPAAAMVTFGTTTGGLAYTEARRPLEPVTPMVRGQLSAGNIDLYGQPSIPNPIEGGQSTVYASSYEFDGKEVLLPAVTPDGRFLATEDEIKAEYARTGRNLGTFETPEAATTYARRLHEDYAAGRYNKRPGAPLGVLRAAGYASLQGFIEVATEWIPAHKLFKDLGARAGLIPTLAHQLKSELIGEEVATAFQDANDWANLPANKDRTIGDYWRERPSAALATVIGTVVAVGATTTAAHATARTLEKLGEAVTDSKTLKRIPEKVTEFTEHVAEGEHFYADADVWGEYWQSKGVDPAVMATQLTGRSDAYAQALTTGQPIAIPRSAYASQLAATEHNGFFTKELRGAPDEFNEREAVEFDKAAGEETVEPQPSPVLTSILDQLLKAGEPAITAAPQAQLHEAVWANLAERAGIPLEALFEPYGVTVEKQTGTGQGVRPTGARAPLTAVPLTGQTPSRAEGQTGAAKGGARPADVAGEQPATDAGRAQQAGGDVARADRRGLSATARPVPSELGETFDRRPLAENQARLTPEVRRELEHMLVEMDNFPFIPRTFTQVEGRAGQGGNAGDYEIRGNVPQAGVYKDVQVFAPVNTFRGKPAKQARGTGAEIIAAVRAVLADGDVPNNLAEGALRVAEARTINDFSNLSPLELPREWADLAPQELVDALSDAIDDALEVTDGVIDDSFNVDEFSQGYADKGPSLFDELPTGEQQPRLPGAEGVREQEIATPQFEAPFSLTSEVAKPQTAEQDTLFQERRAAIRFGPGRKATISLFEGKNLSSFLHESGHLFVEVLGDLSAQISERDPETLTADQRQLLTDYQTLLDWSGYGTVEGKAAAQAASKALRETIGTREATAEEQARLTELAAPHERLADGFLVYLREGKAPTVALQPVFARFRAWLVNLGKSLLGMHVTLTPEVRAVFSRLIASDSAIEEAEARRGAQGIFLTAEQAGMTEPEFGLYRARIEKASAQARARLDRKLTEDVQREQTRSWQAQRAEVEEQVAGEFYDRPEYRALAAMQRGTHPNGQSLMPEGLDSPPLKLSKTMLVERYGAERLKTLPRPYIYTREGGLNPDVLAEQFGYASGDEMLAAVEQAPPLRAAIQEETDHRMLREHGALILDGGALLEQAQTAIASEDHEAIVREELRALNQLRRTVKPFVQAERKAGRQAGAAIRGAIPSQKVLNQIATDRIAAVRIGQLRPDLYWAASRRAHGKAVELAAKQDVEGAITAQQQDLLNLALYREAERVKAWLDETSTTWRQRLGRSDASLAATRQMDYIAAARALADPLLRDEPNPKVADAIAAVKRYDPQMGDLLDGYLEAATQGVPLGQRTVEDARLTYEVIDALWETSRREQQIEIDGQLEQRATARAALTDRLDEIGTGRFADVGVQGLPSRVERLDRLAVTIKAWHRRVESWTTAMDGGPDGPFRRYLWNPVKLAIDAFRVQKVETLKAYQAILEPIQETLTPAKIDAPRLNGYVFGKDGSGGLAELLGALLHSGNRLAPTSNLAKSLVSRGWGAFLADGTLDTSRWDAQIAEFQRTGVLTKAHYDFVQGIWDLFESIKPELQKAHRALYGFYFEEVTADPIETPWGTYRGGYVPAIADPLLSKVAEARYEQQMAFETGTSYSLPTVGRRSTIARKQVFEPLAMNLAFIPQHLDWALRFIHIQPAVRDASRLLTDRSLTKALNAHDPAAKSDMLMPWLMRAATQRLNEKGKNQAFDSFMTAVRTRTGMQALGFHVTNALQQTTGVIVGAVKVKRKHLLVSAAWDHLRAPSATGEAIRAESPFMETFLTSQAIEILQQLDNLILNPSVYGKSAAFLRQHAQFLASGSQNLVNHIVYLAARNDAEQDGLTREQAIRRAESAVRETQGSYFAEDVARVEADTPFMRSLKMFNGYFNMLGNLQTTEGGNAWRADRGFTARVARIGAVYTLGFLLPSAISQVMMNSMRGVGPWDDDEDDTHIDEILNLFLGSPARTALSMVPIFGQIGQAAYGAVFTSQSYDDDIRISPTAGLIGSGIKDLAGHGSTKQTAKDFLSILGLLTNLPLGPVGRPIGYLLDVEAGKVRPTNALEFARGLVTGSSAPRNRRGR